jgi:hypothetical protein
VSLESSASSPFGDLDDASLWRVATDHAAALQLDSDHDDDGYWAVVVEIQRRATTWLFDEAVRLVGEHDAHLRRVACDVLGQIGYAQDRPRRAETLPVLLHVCATDEHAGVVASAIFALGHLAGYSGNLRSLDAIVAHAGHHHSAVRHAVASALPSVASTLASVTGHARLCASDTAVATLVQLTTDPDSDVRDWATFGLGSQLNADDTAIRQCLRARLNDSDDDTRHEAISGLARRHDPTVIPYVREALEAESVSHLAVEAAAVLRHPCLLPALLDIREWWDVDVELLDAAIRNCDPARVHDTARLVEALIVAAEEQGLGVWVASELLTHGTHGAQLTASHGDAPTRYDLKALMQRAAGTVEAAINIIKTDLAASRAE